MGGLPVGRLFLGGYTRKYLGDANLNITPRNTHSAKYLNAKYLQLFGRLSTDRHTNGHALLTSIVKWMHVRHTLGDT